MVAEPAVLPDGALPPVGAPPPGAIGLTVAGEALWLLPQRAVYWPAQGLLLVADVHLGKAASFRHHGVAVPSGTGQATLARLDQALVLSGARRLIVLGDLLHARSGHTAALDRLVADWLAQHPGLDWALLAGNHDRHAGVPGGWRLGQVEEGSVIGPFVLRHAPPAAADPRGYVLAGHVHPAVRLRGAAGQRARLPCFWFGAAAGILPAFGEFTGHHEVRPQPGDRVCVLAGEAVVALASG